LARQNNPYSGAYKRPRI